MNKLILPIAVVLIAGGLIAFFATRSNSDSDSGATATDIANTTNTTDNNANAGSTDTTTTPSTTPPAETPPPATSATVTYSASGFSPATLTVAKGTKVIFSNSASSGLWVSSDPHPTHTDYPGFDSQKSIANGQSYEFTFDRVGSWGYHNHFNPSQTGTIIVN
ncbi:MAG: cupredoxin domain-containing protein [Patescibacteria group bacterium]